MFYYILFNSDYTNLPLDNNYKKIHRNSLIEEFNLADFDYRKNEKDSLNNYRDLFLEVLDNKTFRIDTQYQKTLGQDSVTCSSLYFNYYLDDKGYLDDIKYIKEDRFREKDGTMIMVPDSINFQNKNSYNKNDFEYLIYGLNFIKYKINEIRNEYYANELDVGDIEIRFKEYATTDRFRENYNVNAGLIPQNIIDNAYLNLYDIEVIFENNKNLPTNRLNDVGIILVCNKLDEKLKSYNYKKNLDINDGKHYYFRLEYVINENGELDSISLIPKK